jgi:hypothetical protein
MSEELAKKCVADIDITPQMVVEEQKKLMALGQPDG